VWDISTAFLRRNSVTYICCNIIIRPLRADGHKIPRVGCTVGVDPAAGGAALDIAGLVAAPEVDSILRAVGSRARAGGPCIHIDGLLPGIHVGPAARAGDIGDVAAVPQARIVGCAVEPRPAAVAVDVDELVAAAQRDVVNAAQHVGVVARAVVGEGGVTAVHRGAVVGTGDGEAVAVAD
jgi:hypothetical protein